MRNSPFILSRVYTILFKSEHNNFILHWIQELQQHALGLQPTLTHQANDYELYSTANSECNEALSAEGRTLILEVCQHFVSNAWPSLPQEGVQWVL